MTRRRGKIYGDDELQRALTVNFPAFAPVGTNRAAVGPTILANRLTMIAKGLQTISRAHSLCKGDKSHQKRGAASVTASRRHTVDCRTPISTRCHVGFDRSKALAQGHT